MPKGYFVCGKTSEQLICSCVISVDVVGTWHAWGHPWPPYFKASGVVLVVEDLQYLVLPPIIFNDHLWFLPYCAYPNGNKKLRKTRQYCNHMNIMSMVKFEKQQIFNANLVSQLKANPLLSKDKLHNSNFQFALIIIMTIVAFFSLLISMLFWLKHDVDVFIMSRNSVKISSVVKSTKKYTEWRPLKNNTAIFVFQGAHNETWWIGWFQIIKGELGTNSKMYKQPINLQIIVALKFPYSLLSWRCIIFPLLHEIPLWPNKL